MDKNQLIIFIAVLPFALELLLVLFGNKLVAVFIKFICWNVSRPFKSQRRADINSLFIDYLDARWLFEKERYSCQLYAVFKYVYSNISLILPCRLNYFTNIVPESDYEYCNDENEFSHPENLKKYPIFSYLKDFISACIMAIVTFKSFSIYLNLSFSITLIVSIIIGISCFCINFWFSQRLRELDTFYNDLEE